MKGNLRFVLMATAIMLYCGTVFFSPASGQSKSASISDNPAPGMRKIRLGTEGYLPLPIGYSAYTTLMTADASKGYITSPDNNLRIDYVAGLMQTPSNDDKGKILWTIGTKIGKWDLGYGLKRTSGGDFIIANVPGVSFSAPLRKGRRQRQISGDSSCL